MSRLEAARSLEPHTAAARSIPQVEVRADISIASRCGSLDRIAQALAFALAARGNPANGVQIALYNYNEQPFTVGIYFSCATQLHKLDMRGHFE